MLPALSDVRRFITNIEFSKMACSFYGHANSFHGFDNDVFGSVRLSKCICINKQRFKRSRILMEMIERGDKLSKGSGMQACTKRREHGGVCFFLAI